MAGGNKNIHNHPNANSNGFAKNPQNINKKGRGPSIDKAIEALLEQDGTITIPARQVKETKENGDVVLALPKKQMLAMKLLSMAMSGNNHTSLKALLALIDRVDGKAIQKHEVNGADGLFPTIVGFETTGKKQTNHESDIKDHLNNAE